MRKLELRALVTHSGQQLLSGTVAFKPGLPASEILFPHFPSRLARWNGDLHRSDSEACGAITQLPTTLCTHSQLGECLPHTWEGCKMLLSQFSAALGSSHALFTFPPTSPQPPVRTHQPSLPFTEHEGRKAEWNEGSARIIEYRALLRPALHGPRSPFK